MKNEELRIKNWGLFKSNLFFLFRSSVLVSLCIFSLCSFASAQSQKGWVYVTQSVDTSKQIEDTIMTLDGEPFPSILKKRITLGLVIDDQGHVITRLIDKHPQNITIETSESLFAEHIGMDAVSGFSLLRVDRSKLVPAILSTEDINKTSPYVRLYGFFSTRNAIGRYPKSDYYEGKLVRGIKDFRFSSDTKIYHLTSPTFRKEQDCSLVLNKDGGVNGLAVYDGSIQKNLHLIYPITEIKKISEALIKSQKNLDHGWLGATATSEKIATPSKKERDMNSQRLSGQLNMIQNQGVRVTSVAKDSPAEAAGLTEGDIVSSVNSQQVENFSQLATVMQQMRPGNEVILQVVRNNELKNLKATLAPAPTVDRRLLVFYGIEVQQMTSQLMNFFGVTNGVLITNVLIKNVSVDAGDVITKVGDKTINNINDLIVTLAAYSKQAIPMTISRKRAILNVSF